MSEEMNRELLILKNIQTINDFITVCKIFPGMKNLFITNLADNFSEIRQILLGLDHSFESIPRDPSDLNFYLWICHRFRLGINHLTNFKNFVLIEKMDIVFEYLKRGIFISSSSPFAEMLRSEKDEKYCKSFFALNDEFSHYYDGDETLAFATISSQLSEMSDKESSVKSLLIEYIKSPSDKHDMILSCLFLLRVEYPLETILGLAKNFGKSFHNYSQFESKIKSFFNTKTGEEIDRNERVIKNTYFPNYEKFDDILYKYTGNNLNDCKYISFSEGSESFFARYKPDLFEKDLPEYVSKSDAYLYFWLILFRSKKNINLFFSSFRMSMFVHFLDKYAEHVGDSEANKLLEMFVYRIRDVNPSCLETPDWVANLYYGPNAYLF